MIIQTTTMKGNIIMITMRMYRTHRRVRQRTIQVTIKGNVIVVTMMLIVMEMKVVMMMVTTTGI